MKVADVLVRFAEDTKLSLKDGPRKDYSRAFRRFASNVRLGDYSRRQIAGTTGKKLIKQHLESIPDRSRRWVLIALKSVWIHGLNLPWPIDTRRDVGRLPKAQRGRTPLDADVRPWAEAVIAEKDPYTKLMGLFLVQFGWRPTQIAHLKWRNVEYDASERPKAIVADGVTEDFKTDSPIRAWLPPDVVDAIETFKKASASMVPEKPILPRKGLTLRMKFDPSKMHDRHSFEKLTLAFERKWNLKHLPPKAFRHFVASKCREAGLSYQASAHWQGHDPSSSGLMRDWYDNPEDTFAEQSAKMPRGPLGRLILPNVSVADGLPPEIAALVQDYLVGKFGTMEMASRLEALNRKPEMIVLKP